MGCLSSSPNLESLSASMQQDILLNVMLNNSNITININTFTVNY